MTESAGTGGLSTLEIAPSVTLTFLIADVRGYTSFTVEHGDRAAATLATKFAVIARDCVDAREGEVIELRGDEALAVFTSPRQAVQAAVELQQRFRAETRADPAYPLQVGIGVDTGEAVPVEGGYRGLALNMAARLCSLARAGEVYGTETLIQQAQRLPGLAYVERGRVRLKGIDEPVRVIQIVPEDELPAGFPPLVSLVAKPSNLPLQSNAFVGREQEVQEITALLRQEEVRLVTLTGPGGTGKTRLALQAGAGLMDDFERGVFFVSLASVADPALVADAIAATLKIKEVPGQPLVETLQEYLRDREMLLVLDNFEHVLDGAPVVVELLGAAKQLKVLATSRSALRLTGEHDFSVPPLTVPDVHRLPALEDLTQYDAVALFVQRAEAAKADFHLSADNAGAVAGICAMVDGLPLAIELAAARVRVLPPELLLTRLSRRLSVLTGGARDLPTRQQTLRATIDWSYNDLSGPEQQLFARLSVFAGGCSEEALVPVCDPEGALGMDALEAAASLVDKSLLKSDGEDRRRFVMLETIREYAAQRLEAGGEGGTRRRQHAGYFLHLAEEADGAFRGKEQDVWLGRLELENDNLRAALDWAFGAHEDELALRLSSCLHHFWQVRGHLSEGRRWLEQTLARTENVRTSVHVEALNGAGWLALLQDDVAGARGFLEDGLDLARELGDDEGTAAALYGLGRAATIGGDYEQARAWYEESLELYLGLDDVWGIAGATNDLGMLELGLGEYERARELFEEGLALARHLGQRRAVAILLFNLAYANWCQGSREGLIELYAESLDLFREVGDKLGIAMALDELGMVDQALGDGEKSPGYFAESLELFRELDHRLGCAEWLENQARVAVLRAQPETAARLHGAAAGVRTELGVPLSPTDQAVHARDLAAARQTLGDRWQVLWEEAQSLSPEDAIELALSSQPAPS